MKALVVILVVLALIGVTWTLAFFQVIPAQKIADKSPGAAQILIALGVAKKKPKVKPKIVAQAPAPVADPLASEKAALDAEKQQLDQEKATLDMRLRQMSSAASAPSSSSASDISPKLVSVYGTMKSADIARIFAKLPDSAVVDALNQLDDRQAGKILAALPDARAAKITALMNRMKPPQTSSPTATADQSPQQIASSPG
jgi:flagellar motility protein MotE (MotC chaperone)